jgi:MYXO-CTERM domain-containing protein
MIAGDPTDINSDPKWQTYGGVAPGDGPCDSYLDNALVFDFAKAWATTATTCDAKCIENICSTAAQEIGHVWKRMDHVRYAPDPMTYYGFNGRRYFADMAVQCGSDCNMGKAGALTCYGDGQSHDCYCGGAMQNSYDTVSSLFGLTGGTPPVTTIMSPTLGQSVQLGFPVVVDIQESGTIAKVDLVIDGTVTQTLEDPPWDLNAPTTLSQGTHHVQVVAYDGHMTPGSAAVDVVIGPPCQSEADCPYDTDVCISGRCVAGPNATGGLGTVCSDSSDCASRQCASDGTSSYCVELCQPGDCPEGFGCLDTGGENGACWPGYDEGGGGCGCQTSRGGPAGMALALFVMVVTCRRRRR